MDEKVYKKVVKKIMELRGDGILKKNDLIIMMYLLAILDTEEYREIKQSKICNFTYLTKSEVSKSIKRLLEAEVLERKIGDFESGLKIIGK